MFCPPALTHVASDGSAEPSPALRSSDILSSYVALREPCSTFPECCVSKGTHTSVRVPPRNLVRFATMWVALRSSLPPRAQDGSNPAHRPRWLSAAALGDCGSGAAEFRPKLVAGFKPSPWVRTL